MYVLIFLVLLALAVILLLGYLGFIPSISKMFGTDKPRDLGITYDENDLNKIGEKTDVKTGTVAGSEQPEGSIQYKGEHEAEFIMDESQYTALINKYAPLWEYYPAEEIQVRLLPDGSGEMSGILRVNKLVGYVQATGNNYSTEDIEKAINFLRLEDKDKIPFFVTGTVAIKDNKVELLDIEKIELGRFPIPGNYVDRYTEDISKFIEGQIGDFGGLDVELFENREGIQYFEGMVPDNISVAP